MRASLLALAASGVLAASTLPDAHAEGRGGGLQRAMNAKALGAAAGANRVAIAPAMVSDAADAASAAPSGLSQATGGLSRAGGGLGRATPSLTGAAAGMARPAQGMPKLPMTGMPGATGARPLPANAISIPRPEVAGSALSSKPFPGSKLPGNLTPGNVPAGDLGNDVRMQPPVGRPVTGMQPGTPGMQPSTAQQVLDRRTAQADHLRAVGEQNGNDRLGETADRMQDRAQQNFVRRTEHVEGLRPDGARPDGIRPDMVRPDGVRPEGGVRPENASQSNSANDVPTDNADADVSVPTTPTVSPTAPSFGSKWSQRLKKLWPFGRKSE